MIWPLSGQEKPKSPSIAPVLSFTNFVTRQSAKIDGIYQVGKLHATSNAAPDLGDTKALLLASSPQVENRTSRLSFRVYRRFRHPSRTNSVHQGRNTAVVHNC